MSGEKLVPRWLAIALALIGIGCAAVFGARLGGWLAMNGCSDFDCAGAAGFGSILGLLLGALIGGLIVWLLWPKL